MAILIKQERSEQHMTVNSRNIILNQTSVLGSKTPDVSVSSAGERFKIDPTTRQRTDTLIGYYVNVYSARGEVQTVKLPLDEKIGKEIEKIKSALQQNQIVKVNFGKPSTFKGNFYALNSGNTLLHGITAAATELNVTSIEEPAFDDTFDDIEY
jgi:hypothetical protein